MTLSSGHFIDHEYDRMIVRFSMREGDSLRDLDFRNGLP